MITEQLFE